MIVHNNIEILSSPGKIVVGGNLIEHVCITDASRTVLMDNSFFFKKVSIIYNTDNIVGVFKIPTLYLAYSGAWMVNYQHLITEFYPYLYYYIKSGLNCPVGIPEWCRSGPIDELINLMGLKNIVWLRDAVVHKVSTLYTWRYGRTLNLAEIDWCLQPLKYLTSLVATRCENRRGILYVSRDDTVTATNNNNFAGKPRNVLNRTDLYNYFDANNIKKEYMSRYTILEKAELIGQYDTIITPYGANLINLVFTCNIKNLVILCNQRNCAHIDYYKKLFSGINIILLVDKSANGHFNQPFIVEITELHHILGGLGKADLKLVCGGSIVDRYVSDELFLKEYLFGELLKRRASVKEVAHHLENIQKKGRLPVLYEFTSCREYQRGRSSEYVKKIIS